MLLKTNKSAYSVSRNRAMPTLPSLGFYVSSDDSYATTLCFFTDTSFQSEIPDLSDRPRLLYFWILNGIGPAVRLEWAGQARHSTVSTVASCTNAQSLSSIDSLSRIMLAHTLFRTGNFVRDETRLSLYNARICVGISIAILS